MEYLKTTLHCYVHIHTRSILLSVDRQLKLTTSPPYVYASTLIPAESILVKSKNMPQEK